MVSGGVGKNAGKRAVIFGGKHGISIKRLVCMHGLVESAFQIILFESCLVSRLDGKLWLLLLLNVKMLQRIFMNKICRVFLQFLLKHISDFGIKITINNRGNLGLENCKSFSRVINNFISDTSFSNFATLISTTVSALDLGTVVVMVGASVMIGCVGIGVGICGRFVVSGITDTGTFCIYKDWIWGVSCWIGISIRELTFVSAESLTVLTKEELEESLRN
nr:hypothetical protein [Tanacetum cinerariifolium]